MLTSPSASAFNPPPFHPFLKQPQPPPSAALLMLEVILSISLLLFAPRAISPASPARRAPGAERRQQRLCSAPGSGRPVVSSPPLIPPARLAAALWPTLIKQSMSGLFLQDGVSTEAAPTTPRNGSPESPLRPFFSPAPRLSLPTVKGQIKVGPGNLHTCFRSSFFKDLDLGGS